MLNLKHFRTAIYRLDLKRFEMFKTRQFMPTFWVETAAVVNDDLAFKIRLVTKDLIGYVTLASFVWVLLGLIVIMFTLGYVIAHSRRSVRRKYVITVKPRIASDLNQIKTRSQIYCVFRVAACTEKSVTSDSNTKTDILVTNGMCSRKVSRVSDSKDQNRQTSTSTPGQKDTTRMDQITGCNAKFLINNSEAVNFATTMKFLEQNVVGDPTKRLEGETNPGGHIYDISDRKASASVQILPLKLRPDLTSNDTFEIQRSFLQGGYVNAAFEGKH